MTDALNALLHDDFLSIDQFLLDAFVHVKAGEAAPAEGSVWRSVDGMNGAFGLVRRLLVPGAAQAPEARQDLRLSCRVRSAVSSLEAVETDPALTESRMAGLERAFPVAEAESESTSVAMLQAFPEKERHARSRLAEQGELLANGASPGAGNGKSDAMMTYRAVDEPLSNLVSGTIIMGRPALGLMA